MTCACAPENRFRGFARAVRQTANLMVGIPDYDAYLAHRRLQHPNAEAMTREAFFRDRQDRRYGVGGDRFRCC